MPVKIKGGEKYKKAVADIVKKLGQPGTLRVGYLEGDEYPNGTSVPMIAAIQNFGAPSVGIPPRPFFTNMVKQEAPTWPDKLAKILPYVDFDIRLALEQLGDDIEGALRQSVIDTNSPPLSEITLMLRFMRKEDPDLVVTGKTVGEAAARVAAGEKATGVSTKPLVDQFGLLLNSIGKEIKS